VPGELGEHGGVARLDPLLHRLDLPDPLREHLREGVGAENSDASCDVQVLMDEAAEAIASQRPDGRAGAWGSGPGGRLLVE
jgi:hypothetical protein